MKNKKIIIIIATVLVLLIGGGVTFAINTPTARAERQLNFGNKYLQEGKYQEAILAFQKVIEIEPKNIPARLGLGNAYIATEEFDKAETVLKEVIDIDPNNIPAREELFKVYVKEGNFEAAKSILEEIAALNPDIDLKQFNIDLDLAKTLSASKASYDQGIKQMNEKNYLEAMATFQKVIKEDTDRYDNAQAKISECKTAFIEETLQKAKDAAANKDNKAALALIEQVLMIDSNNQEALKLQDEYKKSLSDQALSGSENLQSNNNNQSTSNGKTFTSRDGFQITIPESWKEGSYYIYDTNQIGLATECCFVNSKGQNIYLFEIIWSQKGPSESKFAADFVGSKNGMYFYFPIPSLQSPDGFSEEEYSNYKSMYNDIAKIKASFKVLQ